MPEYHNFATSLQFHYIAKFSLYNEIFVMLAKFHYIAKISPVAKSSAPVFVFKRLRFGFSPFYPHCNFVVSYCIVISLFLSIYKPQSITNGHQSLMQ